MHRMETAAYTTTGNHNCLLNRQTDASQEKVHNISNVKYTIRQLDLTYNLSFCYIIVTIDEMKKNQV